MLTAPSLGTNIRKMMQNETNELEKELKSHIGEVFSKLVSIMVEAVTMSINKAAKDVDWDKTIPTGSLIEPSKHIIEINKTLNSMFKVLR